MVVSKLKAQLQELVEEKNKTSGRFFDLTVQVLIVISLFTSAIETLPELSEEGRR